MCCRSGHLPVGHMVPSAETKPQGTRARGLSQLPAQGQSPVGRVSGGEPGSLKRGPRRGWVHRVAAIGLSCDDKEGAGRREGEATSQGQPQPSRPWLRVPGSLHTTHTTWVTCPKPRSWPLWVWASCCAVSIISRGQPAPRLGPRGQNCYSRVKEVAWAVTH